MLNLELSISELVNTAWASASTFRGSDKRGGANGARIRLAPKRDWAVNQPNQLTVVLEQLQLEFNQAQSDAKQVSLADLIVLGGCAAIEVVTKKTGCATQIPFVPGRTNAFQEQVDIDAFEVLEPVADGFRNYTKVKFSVSQEELLIDRAQLLNLSAPEVTIFIGGLRVLGANAEYSQNGVFSDQPETLSNDFFINLLDMNTSWKATSKADTLFEGRDRKTEEIKWTSTRVDLICGSNSQLRSLAEVYAFSDAQERFVSDCIVAWNKVMNADRFNMN